MNECGNKFNMKEYIGSFIDDVRKYKQAELNGNEYDNIIFQEKGFAFKITDKLSYMLLNTVISMYHRNMKYCNIDVKKYIRYFNDPELVFMTITSKTMLSLGEINSIEKFIKDIKISFNHEMQAVEIKTEFIYA